MCNFPLDEKVIPPEYLFCFEDSCRFMALLLFMLESQNRTCLSIRFCALFFNHLRYHYSCLQVYLYYKLFVCRSLTSVKQLSLSSEFLFGS